MEIFGAAVRLGELAATAILLIIVLMAYLRARKTKIHSVKMLLVTIGFGVFFVHSIFSIPEIFSNRFDLDFNETWHALIILVGLVFILAGTLKE